MNIASASFPSLLSALKHSLVVILTIVFHPSRPATIRRRITPLTQTAATREEMTTLEASSAQPTTETNDEDILDSHSGYVKVAVLVIRWDEDLIPDRGARDKVAQEVSAFHRASTVAMLTLFDSSSGCATHCNMITDLSTKR